jgi:cytochrome c-type biogenesis protein CcmE
MTYMSDDSYSIPLEGSKSTTGSTINRKFFFAGGALIVLIVGLMIYSTVMTGAYYLTVGEVNDRAGDLMGERIRVSGEVVDDSEDWNAQAVTLKFSITDETGQQLPITFYGPRPDNFQRAASAIIEGELNADGTFHAETLLLKCPSRYDEEPEEIFAQSTR